MALGNIGKYERLDVLGHGASGIVYLARDTLLRRQVAIKEISAQGEERERFLEEARVLDRLRHPNIVEVHNVDTISGKIVIDMEYVVGENLQEILRDAEGALPIDQAVEIAVQVCDGLAYAQARHIVHRDIKPANILVSSEGQVKLVDFGLAQVLGTNSFVGGAGTYAYMAPEDFDEGEASDAQADIWALGVILYEMLTGRRPFSVAKPKDPFAWKRAVESHPIDPPNSLRSEIPEELSNICLIALARSRNERYESAGEFAAMLRRFQNGDGGSRASVGYPQANVALPPTLIGATDLDTFLSAAPLSWETARTALTTGHLARWLRAVGEHPLAEIAQHSAEESADEHSDPDALLREFLYRAGLDTSALARRAANAGSSLLRSGASEEAANELLQAIRLDPKHASYFVQLHKSLIAAGDVAAAALTLSRGLEFHPKDRILRREQDQMDAARPAASPETIDFGIARHGEQVKARLNIRNAGNAGVLQGRIASLPGWLSASPMTFTTRQQQPIALVANTADLWDRDQEYEGLIEIETSGGHLQVGVRVRVQPPKRSFQDIFAWYLPLLLIALLPFLAGEIATVRHPHLGSSEPYYTIGMFMSGILFAALWKISSVADAGATERGCAAIGTLFAPAGAWLLWNHHTSIAMLFFAVSVIPSGLLLMAQGITMRSPKGLGRWQIWGWIVGLAGLLSSGLFWEATNLAIRH